MEILPRGGPGQSISSNTTSMRVINNSVPHPSGSPDLPLPQAKNIQNYLNQNLASNILPGPALPQKNIGMSFQFTQNISKKTGTSGRRTGLTRRQNFFTTSENFGKIKSNLLGKSAIINNKSGKMTESPRGDRNSSRPEIIKEFFVKYPSKDEHGGDQADSKESNKLLVGAGKSGTNLYTFEVVNKGRLRFAGRGKDTKGGSKGSGDNFDGSKGSVSNNCR